MGTRLPIFDFRGGTNTTFSEDSVDSTELVAITNARVGERFAALVKRVGTQRIHTDQIESGATIDGVFQWDDPGGSEIVVISNTDFYHKTVAATTFTEIASTLSTTQRMIFAQHVVAGTATLYMADGALRSFDGTTLTTSITGAPAAKFIAYYKSRMFAVDGTKTLYWSKIADPAIWASPDGGSDPVGVADAEGLVGLCPVGASLLLFKEDSIARFTGTTQATITVGEETEGISADIGCIAPGTIVRAEDFCFFLSDRGPYMATEAGVQPIGDKIRKDMKALDGDKRSLSWAVHNKARQEIWLFVPEDGETTNSQWWIWSYRTGAWTGPHNFGDQFEVACACPYELADGTESVLLGGYDGVVRNGDVAAYGKDDVVLAGTGGTNITMSLEFAPLLMGDPSTYKMFTATQSIQADLKAAGSLTITTNSESQAEDTLTIATLGAGVKQYGYRPLLDGYRPTLTVTEATAETVEINGFLFDAEMGRGPL